MSRRMWVWRVVALVVLASAFLPALAAQTPFPFSAKTVHPGGGGTFKSGIWDAYEAPHTLTQANLVSICNDVNTLYSLGFQPSDAVNSVSTPIVCKRLGADQFTFVFSYVCPTNATMAGTTPFYCTCNSGFHQSAGRGSEAGYDFGTFNKTCVADVACPANGTNFSTGIYNLGTSPQATGYELRCEGGCEVTFSGSVTQRALVAGVYNYYAQGSYDYNGQTAGGSCTAAIATGSVPGPSCASGFTLGQVNGEWRCLSQATGEVSNPHAATTGASTTTTSTVGTTTTTTTSNPDGSTTTTVNNTATGVTTTSTTEGDPVDELCKREPSNPLCSKSSFGGSCAGGFTCEGDAASCAAAKGVHELNCKFADVPANTPAAVVSAAGLADVMTPFNARKTSTDVSTVLQFDQRTLAPGTCPGPYVASTWLGDVSFSVSYLCEIAEIISAFLLLGTILLALRIVVGGA